MNPNKVVEENILKTLKSILDKLSKKHDPMINTITKQIRDTINVLENTPRPPIPTRRYIDALSLLLKYIIKLKGIVEDYINGKLMTEDLYKAVKEYEDKVYLYSKISAKERMKTHLSMLMPTIIIGLTLLYAATLPIILFDIVTINIVLVLLITSIVLLRYNTTIANSLTALASLALLLSIIEKGVELTNVDILFLTAVYVIILAASLSYAHISHITTSRAYLRRLDETLKQLLEEKPPVTLETPKITEIEKSLKDIYRKLYGDKGDEYLSYRLTVLMITKNMKKEEALKKLYDEVKEIRVNQEKK
ncbi:hypothetical protein J4526_04745 [Desulfurococcaceae archaeon MEX13E-LK6-19]|nr:hypothetical protein J4526_04745 [Desulfurococcaceae archaeon MEX13E-LK6-19]